MRKIVKSDSVVVLTGNDRGKTGKVLKVFLDKNQAVVEGVNLIKRHSRPTKDLPQGGIVEKEGPIQMSNLKVVCPKCNQPTRIGIRILEDKSKVRFCKNVDCGEMI
ncbi:MAG: 50S ribosomal protein L24 [Calditrichia bacterium]|jgi:large subunit ribosomal protein L24|nr:50S ribosomal protein L24 [Calditrichia bacterium]MCK5453672.1 50S ribosomal protein L24 [Calditrichia bacterium]OEU67048.1 MAG: 50S ribosomal protein L24 [Desulfobacterales bacterium PC51MH44]